MGEDLLIGTWVKGSYRSVDDSKAAASLKSPPQQADDSQKLHPWSYLCDL